MVLPVSRVSDRCQRSRLILGFSVHRLRQRLRVPMQQGEPREAVPQGLQHLLRPVLLRAAGDFGEPRSLPLLRQSQELQGQR
jgi:hypothetical protein